jgi:hypothetical protein
MHIVWGSEFQSFDFRDTSTNISSPGKQAEKKFSCTESRINACFARSSSSKILTVAAVVQEAEKEI